MRVYGCRSPAGREETHTRGCRVMCINCVKCVLFFKCVHVQEMRSAHPAHFPPSLLDDVRRRRANMHAWFFWVIVDVLCSGCSVFFVRLEGHTFTSTSTRQDTPAVFRAIWHLTPEVGGGIWVARCPNFSCGNDSLFRCACRLTTPRLSVCRIRQSHRNNNGRTTKYQRKQKGARGASLRPAERSPD